VVLGVSPDSLDSHRKFKKKFGLPYQLLSDADHELAEAFGVWQQKSMFGHKYMGNERTTVIIDRKGKVAKIFPKVQIDGHVEEVERALREIG
jgi:peroxiredoxin Q/BCP